MDFVKWPMGESEKIVFGVIAKACECRRSTILVLWTYLLEHQGCNAVDIETAAYLADCGKALVERVFDKMADVGLLTKTGEIANPDAYYDAEQGGNPPSEEPTEESPQDENPIDEPTVEPPQDEIPTDEPMPEDNPTDEP